MLAAPDRARELVVGFLEEPHQARVRDLREESLAAREDGALGAVGRVEEEDEGLREFAVPRLVDRARLLEEARHVRVEESLLVRPVEARHAVLEEVVGELALLREQLPVPFFFFLRGTRSLGLEGGLLPLVGRIAHELLLEALLGGRASE